MAILKHTSSKNMAYSDALTYLKYKHNEDTRTGFYEPILDEFGLLQERENYALTYINGYGQECDPEEWVGACTDTNIRFGKNSSKGERKQHIYVISHPEADTPLLTKEALLEEGKAFVRENLKGYDALVAVHMDTDNCHIHISINSVRSVEREEQPWMMKNEYGEVMRCEVSAGGKHQDNPEFRRHCQAWLMNYTKEHGLTIENNLQIEDERKSRRFSMKHEDVKAVILGTASNSRTLQDLAEQLKKEHDIDLVLRGSTYTLHLPNSKKGVRLSTIGLTKEDLLKAMGITPQMIKQTRTDDKIKIEKRQYIQWLQQRRSKNSIRAEDVIADAASLITTRIQSSGRQYSRADFSELYDLIRQTTYLERDLKTESEKIDRLLDRWKLYLDSSVSETDRESHANYITWCGCIPDSSTDMKDLENERAVVELQIQEAIAVRTALIESAETWKDENEENRFRFQQSWSTSREEQLKQQLRHIKANRKKLGQIAYNCQKAANRRIYNQEYLAKAEHFRKMWYDKLEQERKLKEEIRQVRQTQKSSRQKAQSR